MTIEELNEAVATGEIDEVIRVCEARQVKALSALADRICAQKGVRVILLCGGSSAGKTTTAKRLCTQLRVNGAKALHMSTDDYFVGDARNPRHPDGTFDYETIEAVDSARLAQDLKALIAGESVHLRRFDFVKHDGFDSEAATSITADTYIVLEGIHALNPLLTQDLPEECKFRLFIEPKTQLTVFALTKLPPQDGRLLRRLVRDNQFRKMSPLETFTLWPQVIDGEEKWINPYRKFADAEFDSGLDYELAVLKPYAAGLVELVRRRRPEEKKAYLFTELFEATSRSSSRRFVRRIRTSSPETRYSARRSAAASWSTRAGAAARWILLWTLIGLSHEQRHFIPHGSFLPRLGDCQQPAALRRRVPVCEGTRLACACFRVFQERGRSALLARSRKRRADGA